MVVAHDPPFHTENALTLDTALSFLSRTDLKLFVELKEQGLASSVIEKLVSNKLADRSVVFAFAAVARSFPWEGARPVRLGVIVMCPWNLDRIVRLYAPDVLLLGWDAHSWTRIAFRAWWSFFSLERLARRHQVPVVVGIAQRMKDLDWLAPQHPYGAVADINLIRGGTGTGGMGIPPPPFAPAGRVRLASRAARMSRAGMRKIGRAHV